MNLRNQQKGTTLIEVLVSVVVIAIGLLGIAALQGHSTRYNHSAHLRSIAISQVNNMVDRMYANLEGVEAGHYNNITGIPPDPNCTTCTLSQIAQRDTNQWNTTNAQLLPSGQGTVTVNGNRHIITLRWDGNRTGATGTGCSGNAAIDLSCFIVEVQL
ncbi:type IV pilus modification protein PilV [Legionella israelensis]|uniref:Type IV pilus modification protein PilV n=1 Tax=Legionella israelensis TaxID=454 RepID=A0AAX1EGR7_9GAMM|nr:type IV pilus modification protein PilV [Legionella israelensis]QBR84305.1 type IV pilus modification protein PilV [Legionella israelensis]